MAKDDLLVKREKYMNHLNDQVKLGLFALDAQVQHQRENLYTQALRKKKKFVVRCDMELHRQLMLLDRDLERGIEDLQQQASKRKSALADEALKLTSEHNEKVVALQIERADTLRDEKNKEVEEKMLREWKRYQEMALMGDPDLLGDMTAAPVGSDGC